MGNGRQDLDQNNMPSYNPWEVSPGDGHPIWDHLRQYLRDIGIPIDEAEAEEAAAAAEAEAERMNRVQHTTEDRLALVRSLRSRGVSEHLLEFIADYDARRAQRRLVVQRNAATSSISNRGTDGERTQRRRGRRNDSNRGTDSNRGADDARRAQQRRGQRNGAGSTTGQRSEETQSNDSSSR